MIKLLNPNSEINKEKTIYNAYAVKMLWICYRYLSNPMDAEEAMNNGFLKVFANLDKFKEQHDRSFEYWVRKIMVNECLMFLRQRVNFKLLPIDDLKIPENNTIEIENNEAEEAYFEMVNSLPVGYRTIFNLYAIEGYSHAEIAEMLKIGESTSRSQLSKARKLLQQKIKKDESLYA